MIHAQSPSSSIKGSIQPQVDVVLLLCLVVLCLLGGPRMWGCTWTFLPPNGFPVHSGDHPKSMWSLEINGGEPQLVLIEKNGTQSFTLVPGSFQKVEGLFSEPGSLLRWKTRSRPYGASLDVVEGSWQSGSRGRIGMISFFLAARYSWIARSICGLKMWLSLGSTTWEMILSTPASSIPDWTTLCRRPLRSWFLFMFGFHSCLSRCVDTKLSTFCLRFW